MDAVGLVVSGGGWMVNVEVVVPTLPALSVTVATMVWLWLPVTLNGVVYGVEPLPSTVYVVEATPDPPDSSAGAMVALTVPV